MIILLRHRYWLPCQQPVVQMHQARTDPRTGLILVGFIPARPLAAPARPAGRGQPPARWQRHHDRRDRPAAVAAPHTRRPPAREVIAAMRWWLDYLPMQSAGTVNAEITESYETWERLSDWPRCVLYRPHLTRTAATALVVGTVLFGINHLDAVLHGHTGTGVWVATAVSYLVPFCTSNLGMLAGCRRKPESPGTTAENATGRSVRPAPTWGRPSELPRCLLYPPYLGRTAATALVVGTLYFAVNQLGAVLRGDASTAVWAASGFNYLVPFCVSNAGLLIGCRRRN
jgi:hypothetical protein